MRWYSVVAIYLLFWAFTLFLVLPYGIRNASELGEKELPGQARGAPWRVSIRKKLLWTTIISVALFLPFWLNQEMGWVTHRDLDALFPQIPATQEQPG